MLLILIQAYLFPAKIEINGQSREKKRAKSFELSHYELSTVKKQLEESQKAAEGIIGFKSTAEAIP
jgi:hypothetical protein